MRPTIARPSTLPLKVENIPHELRERPQWVCWRWDWIQARAKWTKVPINPRTGRLASTADPATWGAFEDALARSRDDGLDGIGYVFSEHDPYAGVDLDGCRDSVTGDITPWALEIARCLDSYTEVSPSGRGLHIFVRAALPRRGNRKGNVEFYDRGRYLTVTGHMP
ncbi:MAG: hypothetical protein M3Q65_24940 [Chloroflexota bacterium]|nr:hypothetical protein [Chloroflexota bacterium]